MGTINTNAETENSPENPPLRHCRLTSGNLAARPRHMSRLPMYARYGPERMTSKDVTGLELDGNTLDGYQYTSPGPSVARSVDIVSPR